MKNAAQASHCDDMEYVANAPRRRRRILQAGFFLKLREKNKDMKFSESLKKNRDFQMVYYQGKSQANKYLIMYALQNAGTRNRLGISVSKKVGNSVVRHHLTRLVRESYRLNEEQFKKGYDLVVIVRPSAKEKGYHEIESALLHLGGKLDIR